MSIVDKLSGFFDHGVIEVSTYECPRCGERLEPGETHCPDCDVEAREVTEYVPTEIDPY